MRRTRPPARRAMSADDRAFTVEPCPGGVHWAVIGLRGKIASYHRSEADAQDAADRERESWRRENQRDSSSRADEQGRAS